MKKNEVNFWSVTWGVLMAVLFSAAAAYLGLKVGQVFEAAIPIAIIAVGGCSEQIFGGKTCCRQSQDIQGLHDTVLRIRCGKP